MKKSFPTTRLYLFVALLFTVVLSCKASRAEPAAPAEINTLISQIVFFEQAPELQRSGAAVPVEFGTALQPGDIITTSVDSSCEIQLEGLGRLLIENGSTVALDGLRPAEQRGAVSLLRGSVVAKINKLTNSDDFVIRGPAAVAGVRGTEFSVALRESGDLEVDVREGIVSVFPDFLIVAGLHPAAELVGIETPARLELAELAELPQLSAGEGITIPEAAYQDAEAEFRAAPASEPAETLRLVRSKTPRSRPAVLKPALPDAPSTALTSSSEPLQPVPTTDATGSEAAVLTPPPAAKPAVVAITDSPAAAQPARAAPVVAAPATAEVKPAAPVPPPAKIIQRPGYSISIQPTAPPVAYEAPGRQFPRPGFPRPMRISDEVRRPMTDRNYGFNLINIGPDTARARFQDGRAVVDVLRKPDAAWAVLLEGTAPLQTYQTGRLYALEFTGWSMRDSFDIELHFKEFGTDHDGDGNAYSTYHDTQPIRLSPEPQRYRVFYYHRGPTDTTGSFSFLLGGQTGSARIQDVEVSELFAFEKQGPWRFDLVNGAFDYGVAGWDPLLWKGEGAVDFLRMPFMVRNGIMEFQAEAARPEFWHAQLVQWVSLKKDQVYEIEFDALYEGGGEFSVECITFKDKIYMCSPRMILEPGERGWTRYVMRFTCMENAIKSRFQLNFGLVSGRFLLDNVRIREVQ